MKHFSNWSAMAVLSLALCAAPAHAQLGAGPQPPTAAQPDKFPNLAWTASTSGGVTYNVYRGVASGGPKGRINVAPVTPTAYRDTSAAFGVQNYYTVTAQRTSDGIESTPSNEVSATAVQGSPAPPTSLNAVLAFLVKIGKTVWAGLRHFGGIFG